ncbi:Histidine ammonia-lyase [Streptomyces glaucescens]
MLAAHDARRLAALADICTALASEALLGNRGHYAAFIHDQRPHPGQRASARLIGALLEGSHLSLPHSQIVTAASYLTARATRNCAAASRTATHCAAPRTSTECCGTPSAWTWNWLETEINASTDNPLFDTAGETVHSGGNFYAGHVAQSMDALKVAVANVADLLDRQLELLVDEKFNNGLTPNLIPRFPPGDREAGLHHGFKGMQIAASALPPTLGPSSPPSVHSRSTEARDQDKVSLAPIAARQARSVVARLRAPLVSDDTVAFRTALTALGARLGTDGPDDCWEVTGIGRGPAGPALVLVRGRGHRLRFLPPFAATGRGTFVFDGSEQLRGPTAAWSTRSPASAPASGRRTAGACRCGWRPPDSTAARSPWTPRRAASTCPAC